MGTTKKRFIELHGEEAWEIEAQKRSEQKKEYQKKWYKEHREERLAYAKEYVKENKEKRTAYIKQYNKEHKEDISSYLKKYSKEHKEERASYKKQWYQEKKAERKAYAQKWQEDNPQKYRGHYLYLGYRRKDKLKGFDTKHNITTKWIIDNIFSGQSCVYCGDSDWTHLGADRIDNSKPHTPDNVVCSCFLCNCDRNDKYSVDEFKEYRKTHPRFSPDQKSWEIIEMKGIKVLKKRAID